MPDSPLNPRSLIFLLSSIALITLPHSQHIPLPLFAFFALMLGWRALGIWHRRWLPNRLMVFLLSVLGMALLFTQQKGVFGRDAGTALFVVALGLKLLEIRDRRDIYLIVYLAFIVAASQFLYEQSILMAGYILLVSTVLLATLITQNAQQTPTILALKSAAVIVLQALPIAVVAFVLFPRLEAPRWMWLDSDNKAQSGLSNTLEPGSITDLSLSDELVFRVRFVGDPPPPQLRYWRGPVYSHTDGVRWTAVGGAYQRPAEPVFAGKAYQYTLLMEPQKERWVFALDMAEAFDSSLRRNAFYQLLTTKKPGDRAEYRITSYPLYNTGAISNNEYRDNLQLPAPPSAKLSALVEKLHGFDASPERFIDNLLQYFRQEAFYYTLTPPLMPDNPIETFLFETRSGFCSHYATAFVYLLRMANIPARVVGGYQGGQINKIGDFLEVRQADAHAWAEVWLGNKGWVRFDPTAAIAPERIERGVNIDLQIASGAVNFSPIALDASAINWLKRSRQLWQSIDYNWQRWIINYNGYNQTQLLQSLGIDDWLTIAKTLLIGITLISLLLAWWLLRRKNAASDQVLQCYQRFCAKLADAGVEIGPSEGARDFAERAQAALPGLSVPIARITALYIRLRYEANATPGDFKRLKKQIAELKV